MSDMANTAKIILINGPSSAGKTTLALALRDQLDIPFLRFSYDLFIDGDVLPLTQIRNGTFSWEDMRPAVFKGFHKCLRALAAEGNNLLVDHIVESQENMDMLVEQLRDYDVYFVGLHCSLEELERRELARGNRHSGDARADLEIAHRYAIYDLELNAEDPLEENVATLITAWRQRSGPNAFDKLAETKEHVSD